MLLWQATLENSETKVAKMLLIFGSNANHSGRHGMVLEQAVVEGNLPVVRLMLQHGRDLRTTFLNYANPLMHVCTMTRLEYNHISFTNLGKYIVIKDDVAIDKSHTVANTIQATNTSKLHIADAFIQQGEDINYKDCCEETPLFCAVQCRGIKMIKLFLDNGANVNKANYEGVTPLLVACHWEDLRVVPLLLAHEANVHVMDKDGNTPLLVAYQYGCTEFVRALLRKFDMKKHEFGDDIAPYLHPIPLNTQEIAAMLLGAGFHIKDAYPLVNACDRGDLELAGWCLRVGGRVNGKVYHGNTPLLAACSRSHLCIVTFLLPNGAEVDLASTNGETPLMLACEERHVDIIWTLLEHGADPTRRTTHGDSVYRYAQNQYKLDIPEIERLLTQYTRAV